jgi:hypothetical protein
VTYYGVEMGHHLIGGQFTIPLDQITAILIENNLLKKSNSQVVRLWQLVGHCCNLGIGHGYEMLRIASRLASLACYSTGVNYSNNLDGYKCGTFAVLID